MSGMIILDLSLGELTTLLMLSREQRGRVRDATTPGARHLDRLIRHLEAALQTATTAPKQVAS
jgi:hypothetical protein